MVNLAMMTYISLGNITNDNIVAYDVLENGNYFVTVTDKMVISEEGDEIPCIIECEITKEGFLVSKIYHYIVDSALDMPSSSVVMKVSFQYNKLTETEVQANIDKYIASLTQNA